MKKQYWTIVFSETLKPILPLDSFDIISIIKCESMMVFCNKDDAETMLKYQKEKYGWIFDGKEIKVVQLGEERCCQ